jgi:hypothetical protein
VTILNFWASEITADVRGSLESLREKRQSGVCFVASSISKDTAE